MSEFTKSDVLGALSRHIGKDNGATATALVTEVLRDTDPAQLTGGAPGPYHLRLLRHHITELREEGAAICATPSAGYYIAATWEELEESCAFLRSRALHSLRLEAQLRRIPLPTLLGQLNVET